MTIKEFEIQLALGTLSIDDIEKLAGNPNTPIDILKKLSTDKNNYVRCRVALNSNTPKEVLKKLSTDKDNVVRSYVVDNPSTPIDVLKKLSKDEDWYVRYRANFTTDMVGR